MKKNKIAFLLTEFLLLLLVLFCIGRIFDQNTSQKRVAVVLPDSGNERWNLLIKGMKQAAKDQDVHLIICNTDEIENARTQAETIKEQESNDVDAYILCPAPGTNTKQMLMEKCGEVPVMLITEDIYNKETDEGSGYPLVGANYYDVGYELASQTEGENLRIGIVAGWRESESTKEAVEGISDVLKKNGGKICWYCYKEKDADVIEKIDGRTQVDVLLVLDSKSLCEIGERSLDGAYGGALIYGVGSGEKSVCLLDNGKISGLLLLDGYEVGYQSVEEISEKLNHKLYKMKSYETDVKIVDKGTIFSDEEMERFLYSDN